MTFQLETVPPARPLGIPGHELIPLEWCENNVWVTMRCSCGQRVSDFQPQKAGKLESALAFFERHCERERKTDKLAR